MSRAWQVPGASASLSMQALALKRPSAELQFGIVRRAPNGPIWESALQDAIAPAAEVILPMLAHDRPEAANEGRRT